MTFTTHSLAYGLTEGRFAIPYQAAHDVFLRLYGHYVYKFFFESKDVSPIYGRFNLMGVDPALRLRGKNDGFEIEALNERGLFYLNAFQDCDFQPYESLKRSKNKISGVIRRSQEVFEESERSKQHNISVGIRVFLRRFSLKTKGFLGLYGAFSYDFVRQFETLPSLLPDNDVQDFDLFLYDTFVFFDLLKEKAELIAVRKNRAELARTFSTLRQQILQTSLLPKPSYSISNEKFLYTSEEYQDLVRVARQYAKEGELVEVVFSNVLKARFQGDPMGLYLRYREANPSPYLFYFDLGKEQLVGASPEMMVRVEDGKAHMRPISGTAKRGRDPIEDHENMLALLSDPKERAELDMLIDLGRNDLSRICEPRVAITDYRFVEKYSRVMHTVAHLSGTLKPCFTAFDALIACLNAGTLTGAPKVAAMTMIEKHEKERRGYYGGTIGYLTCSGEMDTGIIIRTAHIRGETLRFQVGATLLYRSVPEREYQETLSKARAFLDTLRPSGQEEFSFARHAAKRSVSSFPHLPQGDKKMGKEGEEKCGEKIQGSALRYATCVGEEMQEKARTATSLRSATVLVIDNFDSFTFNLVDYFKQLGCRVLVYRNTIDPDAIPALEPDAIVFSPGPSLPKNAGNMMKIINQYHQRYPMLGVCLGMEAMVECFGGTLRLVDPPVHGEASPITHDGKTLFKDLPQGFMAGRYHSLVGDCIPDCFEISARTQDLVMGIRHKTFPIEAVQFHPESVLTMKGDCGFLVMKNFLETYLGSGKENFCEHFQGRNVENHDPKHFAPMRTKILPDRFQKLSLKVIDFLKDSIVGQISLQDQKTFLREHHTISAHELAEAVRFLLKQMPEQPYLPGAIDVCGTGGSGLSRFNTSTLATFVLASEGVGVAKHGNKAASGRCGSFDLLEALGIPTDSSLETMEKLYKMEHMAFLFARRFHPVMKAFAEVRKSVGQPTFFNLLGPLLSPAGVKRQIIGTSSHEHMELLAETCRELGREHVYIVCGEDGLDEVTLTGKTFVTELKKGRIRSYTLTPQDFGVKPATFTSIRGGGLEENVKLFHAILKGEARTRHADLVAVNAGLALVLSGKTTSLKEGYGLAKTALKQGRVADTFERFKQRSTLAPLLLDIVYQKEKDVACRRQKKPLEIFKYGLSGSDRNFKEALERGTKGEGRALIAEIKRKSPSRGALCSSGFDIEAQAQAYERAGAQAISVVTDTPFFGGKLEDMAAIRRATRTIPILCKDFILDEYQVYEARHYGANAILLIASILTIRQMESLMAVARSLGMDVLCEVHTEEELEKVLGLGADIVGVNHRNLHDFSMDKEVMNRLMPLLPSNVFLVAESGIYSAEDVRALPKRAQAMLVGTALMTSENSVQKIMEFRTASVPFLKVCGIRLPKEALFCEKIGVEMIGLNFVPSSQRCVSMQQAHAIKKPLKSIQCVGVFQNQPLAFVNRVAKELDLDFIQLAGEESVSFVKKCRCPVLKTIALKTKKDIAHISVFEPHVSALMIDGPKAGSGRCFDFSLLKNFKSSCPYFMAGGIDSKNVKKYLLAFPKASGIDTAGGVEIAGCIDLKKVKTLYSLIHFSHAYRHA